MFMDRINLLKTNYIQVIAVLTGTLLALSDGMQYGWTAPVTPILLNPNSPIKATQTQVEWLETILMLGACCGLPITMNLVNKIGRKKSLLLAAAVNFFVWIIIGTCNRIEYLLAARFFSGLAGDMAFVAAPMYIAEIANEKIRGFLSSCIYLMMLFGVLIVYITIPYISFYVPPILGCTLLSSQLIIFPFMPDSPYYLIYKNKPEEAKEALQFLRQRKDVDEELESISNAIERQKGETEHFKDLFLTKSNQKALIIMVFLNASQHMSGISVLFMNLHSILNATDSRFFQPEVVAVLFSGVMLIAAMSASLLIDRFGRKVLLITSGLTSGFCLICLATYLTLKLNDFDMTDVSWIPTVAVMVYAAAFKFGIGLVPIVMTAELFPANFKAIGMSISNTSYVLFSAISLQIFYIVKNSYGLHVPFYIFGFSCFCTVGFTIFYIPETKGKTLNEIQMILKGKEEDTNSIKTT